MVVLFEGGLAPRERESARSILSFREEVNEGLFAAANGLSGLIHDFLDELPRDARPNLTFSVRSNNKLFGPRLVWVRTFKPVRREVGGSPQRRTVELKLGTGFVYRARIFDVFDADVRPQMVLFEREAAEIRERTRLWHTIFSGSESLFERVGEGA